MFVVAPNAPDQCLTRMCAAASGMIYAPATADVTGGQGPLRPGLRTFVDIGVSTGQAALVGSAFIRAIDSTPTPPAHSRPPSSPSASPTGSTAHGSPPPDAKET